MAKRLAATSAGVTSIRTPCSLGTPGRGPGDPARIAVTATPSADVSSLAESVACSASPGDPDPVSSSHSAGPGAGERPATFRAVLAVPEFLVLFTGFGVFMVGETAKMLALAVLVYDRTGSPLLSAFAYVVGFLPHAVGGLFLISLADRWPPRALLVGYDLLRLTSAALLACGVLPPAGMLGLVFAVGLLAPVSTATRNALLPELLSGDSYVLGRSLFTVAAGATQVLGFAAGGLLLNLVGPYGALWLTAATCAISALLTRYGLTARPARSASAAAGAGGDPAGGRSGVVGQTWRVNRLLLADPRIRGLLLAQWLPGALVVAAEGVIVPYVSALGRAADAGVLFAASALGMLTGELAVGRLLAPARRERLTPWLALLLGAPMLAFVARPALATATALFWLSTLGFGYQLGLARRFVSAVPESRRGQAFGLLSTGLMTTQGVAAGLAGALAEVLAPGTVMALAGLASLTATGLLWRRLRPRPADARDADTGPPAPPRPARPRASWAFALATRTVLAIRTGRSRLR